MPFMIPEYANEAFLVGETSYGERVAAPFSAFCSLRSNDCAYAAKHDTDVQAKVIEGFVRDCNLVADTVEIVHGKHWCRLSAPGYMDATDWDGPYPSQKAAENAVSETYDVDPDTGEDLDDGNSTSQRQPE